MLFLKKLKNYMLVSKNGIQNDNSHKKQKVLSTKKLNQKSYLRKISKFEGRILESVSNMEVVARRPSPLARCPSFISPVFVLRRHRRCLWWHLWWLSSSIVIVTVVVRGTSSITRHPSAPFVVVAVRRRQYRCPSPGVRRRRRPSSGVCHPLFVARRPSHIARRTSSIVCPPWLARRPSLVASVRPPRRPSRFRRPSFVRPPRRVRRRRRHRYLSVRPLVVAVLCPSVPSVLRHKNKLRDKRTSNATQPQVCAQPSDDVYLYETKLCPPTHRVGETRCGNCASMHRGKYDHRRQRPRATSSRSTDVS